MVPYFLRRLSAMGRPPLLMWLFWFHSFYRYSTQMRSAAENGKNTRSMELMEEKWGKQQQCAWRGEWMAVVLDVNKCDHKNNIEFYYAHFVILAFRFQSHLRTQSDIPKIPNIRFHTPLRTLYGIRIVAHDSRYETRTLHTRAIPPECVCVCVVASE